MKIWPLYTYVCMLTLLFSSINSMQREGVEKKSPLAEENQAIHAQLAPQEATGLWEKHFSPNPAEHKNFLQAICSAHPDDCVECNIAEKLFCQMNLTSEQIEAACTESLNRGHFGMGRLYLRNPEIFKGCAIAKICDKNKHTLLHYAAAIGDFELAKHVYAKGANIDALSAENNTPLLLACLFHRKEIVSMLLVLRAEANIRNNQQWTPLLAVFGSDDDYVKILLAEENWQKYSDGIPALINDAIDASLLKFPMMDHEEAYAILIRLLMAGVNVAAQTQKGNTAIMNAAFLGSSYNECILTLIRLGCPLDLMDEEQSTFYDIIDALNASTCVELHNQEIKQLLNELATEEQRDMIVHLDPASSFHALAMERSGIKRWPKLKSKKNSGESKRK